MELAGELLDGSDEFGKLLDRGRDLDGDDFRNGDGRQRNLLDDDRGALLPGNGGADLPGDDGAGLLGKGNALLLVVDAAVLGRDVGAFLVGHAGLPGLLAAFLHRLDVADLPRRLHALLDALQIGGALLAELGNANLLVDGLANALGDGGAERLVDAVLGELDVAEGDRDPRAFLLHDERALLLVLRKAFPGVDHLADLPRAGSVGHDSSDFRGESGNLGNDDGNFWDDGGNVRDESSTAVLQGLLGLLRLQLGLQLGLVLVAGNQDGAGENEDGDSVELHCVEIWRVSGLLCKGGSFEFE